MGRRRGARGGSQLKRHARLEQRRGHALAHAAVVFFLVALRFAPKERLVSCSDIIVLVVVFFLVKVERVGRGHFAVVAHEAPLLRLAPRQLEQTRPRQRLNTHTYTNVHNVIEF